MCFFFIFCPNQNAVPPDIAMWDLGVCNLVLGPSKHCRTRHEKRSRKVTSTDGGSKQTEPSKYSVKTRKKC